MGNLSDIKVKSWSNGIYVFRTNSLGLVDIIIHTEESELIILPEIEQLEFQSAVQACDAQFFLTKLQTATQRSCLNPPAIFCSEARLDADVTVSKVFFRTQSW